MNSRLKLTTAADASAAEATGGRAQEGNSADADHGCSSQGLNRHYLFAFYFLLSIAVCWTTMKSWLHAALHLDFCSQIIAAPFIAVLLVLWRRREIFRRVQSGYLFGGLLFLIGVSTYWFAMYRTSSLTSYDSLSLSAFGIVVIWLAGFYAIYGRLAFRAAAFPAGFLFLTVPIPSYLLDQSILYLQAGSTAIAHILFVALGIPVMRRGFLLYLPGLTIEVAKECSSIRSSLALVITCLLAGFLFIRSASKTAALVLLALPVSVLKNGVRIVTLSLLSIYVNPAFMQGDLHRDGGILFYLLALAILFPIFRWLEGPNRPVSGTRNSATELESKSAKT